MVKKLKNAKLRKDEEIVKTLHPFVKEWFFNEFPGFSLPQKFGVMPIWERKNILISAPTGGTKCLTPDETVLINEKESAKLIRGEDLIKKGKKGRLVKNVDKTGKLKSVEGLESYSLKKGKISKTDALVYSEHTEDELLEIKTEYGREVKISKDHPLLVEKKGWTKAEDLEEGDKIAAPKRINLPEKEIVLKWEKALENLKKKARFCITYTDYSKLKEKVGRSLNSEDIKKILALLRLSYESVHKELGVNISTIHKISQEKTNFKRKEFERYLQKKLENVNFEKNRVIYKTHGSSEFSFKYPKKLNSDLAGWAAFLLAEGFIGNYKTGSIIAVSQKNKKRLLKKFLEDSKKYFDVKFKKKNDNDYCVYSTLFAEFISDLFSINKGRGRNVQFPGWVLNCKKKEKKIFIYTFFSLEASVTNRIIKLSQANKEKIESLNYLLMSFGIFCSVRKFEAYASNTESKKKRKYYQISISQIRNLHKFIYNIGLDHKIKNIRKHLKNKTSGTYVNKYAFDFKKIRKLSKYYPNDLKFKEELGNIYEVVRKSGYITGEALEKLHLKAKKDFPEDPVLEDIEKILNTDIFWLKIKKIKKFNYKGKVFDLTVPDVHNFIGGFGGLVLHNTLTAFLSILNYLVNLADKNELEDKIYAVYVSPLKALSNDIHVNLKKPLKEIREIGEKRGKKLQKIRVGLRTGDTPTKERTKQTKNPPHILVTTPETLAIVLNAKKFSNHFEFLEYLIVDEIHALDNKRGVHLSLSLERLEEMSSISPVRIGLSATIAPLEEVAKFLTGNRECIIADVKFNKNLDINISVPVEKLTDTTGREISEGMYNLIDKMVQEHKTTLIFTNTRAATERIVHHLKERFPENYSENIGAHHGSLSKSHRFSIEERLRRGDLKVVVSSTSLELGIDIGYIDLVILLGSPKSTARGLQRCLSFDSKILCSDGKYRKIGNIVENKEDVGIISYDKDKGFVKNNIKKWHENGVKNILRIKLKCGEEIKCTNLHPILTKKGWKKAINLEEGDKVAEIKQEINFDKESPFIYEMVPEKKVYIQNKENFFRKTIDKFLRKKVIDLKEFSKVSGIPYLKLINYRRCRGRKRCIRLDYFLKVCKICGIPKRKYKKYMRYLKTRGRKWSEWPLKLNEELMWLAGIVATDGDIIKSRKEGEAYYYKIKICNKSYRLIEEVEEIVKKFDIKPYKEKREDLWDLEFGSNILAHLFMNLGIPCKNKTINVEVNNNIFSLNNQLIHSYLEGVFEGDGNISIHKNKKRGTLRIFTASKKFSQGIHLLLSRMGYKNSVARYKSKKSKLIQNINQENIYCIFMCRKEELKKFFKNIKGRGEKSIRGKRLTKNFGKYLSLRDGYDNSIGYSEVKRIKKEKKEKVYNLSLDKPNNFIVGNVIVHNCGRAGHKLHETAKGRFIVMDRDDLVECSVMKKEMVEKKIDRVHIPKNCLDVLSQQIYGMAINKKWKIKEMFNLIKRSYCYSKLDYEDFLSVISYMKGDYALEDKHVYAKIWYDEDTDMIGKRGRLARVIYMTNIGTIPDESYVGVYARGSKEKIGMIDESFLERLKKGDVFVLGGSKYQYLYSRGMKVYVNTSVQRPPTIPSWFSEMLPLSFDLAMEISRFRKLIGEKIGKVGKKDCKKFIENFCYVSKDIAKRMYDYFLVQHKYAGIPSEEKIIIERYKAEKEYWIFHTLFGRRVNDALSRAFAYLLGQIGGRDIEIGISDNGFYFVGEDLNRQKIEKVFGFLDKNKLEEVLKEAIEKTQLLKRRFRHCAGRALMILRQYKGRKKSAGVQQLRSRFILGAVKKISKEFPILKEAKREILEDVMDLDNASKIVDWIKEGKIDIKFVNKRLPSPFALNLIMQARYDLIKIENKMEFLKRIHQEIQKQVK